MHPANYQLERNDRGFWIAHAVVEKRLGEYDHPDRRDEYMADVAPYDVTEAAGNLLTYGGMSNLWQSLIGAGGAGNLAYFNNANAHLGVGDSSAAEAATQTDLSAATNKLRKAMVGGYPTHTDGTTSASNTITFRSDFLTAEANWVWNEWATFNAAAAGRMLNRKVASLGTKTTGTWTLTVTIQLA